MGSSQAGHHGSDSSTTYPFLREIMPAYAVVSVGVGNEYGHPTESTLSRLRAADVKVYRTDLQGTIICTSDGRDVSFTVSKNENTDTLLPAGVAPQTESVHQDTVTEAAECTYILNTNTMKFHYEICESAEKIKEHNKEYYTGTREDIVSMGYVSCGNCRP